MMAPGLPQLDKKTLLILLKTPLKKLIDDEVDPDCEQEKIVTYRTMRRNHLYFEGKQNIVPQWIGTNFADFGSSGAPLANNFSPDAQVGQFDYVFNIIRGDCLKAVAVMGKAPTVRAVADDPESDDGERQAILADVVAQDLHDKWNMDEKTRQTAFILWILGPAFGWTYYSADGAKYGYTEEPVIETQDVPLTPGRYACPTCHEATEGEQGSVASCPTCGGPLGDENFIKPDTVPIPHDTGKINKYENGSVELDIYSALEVSISFYAAAKLELEYLKLERDMPKGKLVTMYPQLRDKLESASEGGTTSSKQSGVEVRGSLSSPTGVRFPHPNLWRSELNWLKPSIYELIKGDVPAQFAVQGKQKLCDLMKDIYPKGCRLDFVNGDLVDIKDEDLFDCWEICKPTVSSKLMSDALCTDEIPAQDITNNTVNMQEEAVMKQLPALLVSNEIMDRESLENRPPNAADFIWTKPGGGVRLQDQVYPFPVATISPDVTNLQNSQREMGRELVGVNRSIYGGYDPTEKTAKQALIEKQMALMQMSITYDNIRAFNCGLTLNAVKQMAQYGTGQIRVASDEGFLGTYSRTADIAELADEGYHFEADPGMPDTFAERRDGIKDIMLNAPPISTAVGFDSPFNAGKLQRYLGVPGMWAPVEAAREKVRRAVKKLLAGQIVQVDAFDDHAIVSDLLRAWMISDEGQQAQDENPNFQNVVNFWQQHKLALSPPAPPPGTSPVPPPGVPQKPIGKPLHAKPNGSAAAASTNIAAPPGTNEPGPISAPPANLPIQ